MVMPSGCKTEEPPRFWRGEMGYPFELRQEDSCQQTLAEFEKVFG